MAQRAQKIGSILTEYYSSKQGMVAAGSVLVTVAGLIVAKSRIAALGVAVFGFVVFPVTTVNQWRAVRRLEANGQGRQQPVVARSALKKLSGRQTKLHASTQNVRRSLRPMNTQLRRIERRLARGEPQRNDQV